MKHFAILFRQLEETNKTNEKLRALVDYFELAEERDKLWTIALFSHKRPRRTVPTSLLRKWASEAANIPLWLFEESYHIVGDLAETIALVLPAPVHRSSHSLSSWIEEIIRWRELSEDEKEEKVKSAWSGLTKDERFLFNKLLTGGFRMGISQKLMTRALARHIDKDESEIAHRLMGDWKPSTTDFQHLLFSDDIRSDVSKPYPFYLAYAVENDVADLGQAQKWEAEWKWDGIRGQLICRSGEIYLWSRGEELITHQFPELQILVEDLPDGCVLDGEILAMREGKLLGFQSLQKRLGRKKPGKKIIEEHPVVFMAYDVLEWEKKDIRSYSYLKRRSILEKHLKLTHHDSFCLSTRVEFSSWTELKELRKQSRAKGTEGFMLKQGDSPYLSGRKKGDWWKWKVEPSTIDGVMLYAQRGHGRRSNLYSDFTFAVWDEERLVPFAKAYSGLTDAEFKEITTWVKKHTKERFGPVCSVEPLLVFELAFEGIQESKRHKSGVALRFPRIKRWRKDKLAKEANHLKDLKALL